MTAHPTYTWVEQQLREPTVCERFLGNVQRECLDHILDLGESPLHRVLQPSPPALRHRTEESGGDLIRCGRVENSKGYRVSDLERITTWAILLQPLEEDVQYGRAHMTEWIG